MRKLILTLIFFSILLYSCDSRQKVITKVIDSSWQFRKAGDTTWLPAKVPGCVHTDLLASNKMIDPFYRKNEQSVKWIENADWEYLPGLTFLAK